MNILQFGDAGTVMCPDCLFSGIVLFGFVIKNPVSGINIKTKKVIANPQYQLFNFLVSVQHGSRPYNRHLIEIPKIVIAFEVYTNIKKGVLRLHKAAAININTDPIPIN